MLAKAGWSVLAGRRCGAKRRSCRRLPPPLPRCRAARAANCMAPLGYCQANTGAFPAHRLPHRYHAWRH